MRVAGRVHRSGKWWAIDLPLLGIHTQGSSKSDAFAMIVDAVEMLVDRKSFRAVVHPGKGDRFELEASDAAALTALMLKRVRARSGLSLSDVAKRLGAKSLNAYARYEQGRATPTIGKLCELFSAVSPDRDLVLGESESAG
jgi:predicted RNase H-like HicB family nuclease/DNA-binding XRE family transcriptional regulator